MKRLLALTLALTACTPRSAGDVLERAGASLQDLRSGEMEMRMTVGLEGGEEVGFSVDGPFSFEGDRTLPVARLRVTRIIGSETEEAVFVSDGRVAAVEAGGRTTPVAADDVPRVAPGIGGEPLPLETWVANAQMRQEGETYIVTGDANAAAVLSDLFAMARDSGVTGDDLVLAEEERAHIGEMVRSSEIEVEAEGEDVVLTAIDLLVELGPHPDFEELTERLGGVQLRFTMRLDRVNEDVSEE